ncbi:MAG: SRPBCC domain-containing protein [Candidatus Bathyarchaeota archaeon]
MEPKEKQGLKIKVAIQILKPANTVFEAIINPEKMTNYFISKSSGKMMEGKTLTWKFPEFETEFPIYVENIEQDRYISYHWETDGEKLLVEITLDPVEDDATVVTVTEKTRENDEAGIKWLAGNTAGWANFLACLKAYLEHEINLRKGAFTFLA